MATEDGMRHFRTLFISDVHLGARGCQVGLFLDFLRFHDAETIYLVGDIVDTWRLRAGWYWPQGHNDVVQKLLRKARKGTNPFNGEPMMFKAKPARKIVRARPVKAAKDAV